MKCAVVCVLRVACGDGGGVDTSPIDVRHDRAAVGDAGKGSWRFGAASAATQIEDMNPNTDWYLWTAPVAEGGLGKGTFVGDAVQGYSLDLEDVGLVGDLGVDSYRFSIEWARIEPAAGRDRRGRDRALPRRARGAGRRGHPPARHRAPLLEPGLGRRPARSRRARTARPTPTCAGSAAPAAPQIIAGDGGPRRAARPAVRRSRRRVGHGQRADELHARGVRRRLLPARQERARELRSPSSCHALRDYIAAHAAMYKAIKATDTIDADGDGVAAAVGFSMSVADWEPARKNKPSDEPRRHRGARQAGLPVPLPVRRRRR